MNKQRKQIIANNEVSNLYTFNLGGYNQKVLVEGKSKTLPVVICLHGGPGTPIPFSVGCRGLFPEFTDQFIMVYWDQLGCGANNHKIDDSFTVDMFVSMTKDLIAEIKRFFPENDLYMFATSWGSVLSVKVLQEMPNEIKGVVVYGQLVKNLFYNQEVYDALSQTKLSAKKLEAIKNANIDNITTKDLM
ncbi:MAG: alpha/beta fold hydrolase, partial [Paludibacteraceae bacterium]|nr:alpha/beta fold hydrolase [Paludibacteraceae bacterium]